MIDGDARRTTFDDFLYFALPCKPTIVFFVLYQSQELVGGNEVVQDNDLAGVNVDGVVVDLVVEFA